MLACMSEQRSGWRWISYGLGSVLAVLVLLVIGALLFGRSGARIEGVVTHKGVPVPGALVILTVSPMNEGQVVSIPFIRPREVVVTADAAGRYIIEHARTDASVGIFALSSTGRGAHFLLRVQPVAGETVTVDIPLPVRAQPDERSR